MEDHHFTEVYKHALEWVKRAGDHLGERIHEIREVEYKTSGSDIVTEMDRKTEQFLVDLIKRHYPGHYIMGEEGMMEEEQYDPQKETVWIIDPIDGTLYFVHQKRNFAVSVGIYHKGKPVIGVIYDPIAKECFHVRAGEGAYLNEQRIRPASEGDDVSKSMVSLAGKWLIPNEEYDYTKLHPLVRDLRDTCLIGAASLEIAYIACGRIDGYLNFKLSPWDFAGGYALLYELGIPATTTDGKPLNVFEKSSFFAAKSYLHDQILKQYFQIQSGLTE